MKLLVITTTQPTQSLVQRQGITWRLQQFLQAFGALADQVRIAHLVPAEASQKDAALEGLQSQFWGMPLKLTLIARAVRQETFRTHYLDGMLQACDQPLIFSFAGPEQADAVGQLLDQDFDLVFVHRLPAMCAVLRSGRRPRNVFFDIDDIEHVVRLRYAFSRPLWLGKLAYAAHVPALLWAERQGIALSRQSFVCSRRDQNLLRRWSAQGKVAVIPNALPLPPLTTPPSSDPTLLFIGACDYRPNADAAERLVTKILPLIRAKISGARVLIAGKGSETLPSRSQSPANVEYLGYAPDLDALYARTRIVCCPLLNGGGTRVKLIEAAGYARPMVSTHIGAEGLDFEDNREILLRDSDQDFAQACVQLLQDERACLAMGQVARARMRALYEVDSCIHKIRNLVLNNLEQAS